MQKYTIYFDAEDFKKSMQGLKKIKLSYWVLGFLVLSGITLFIEYPFNGVFVLVLAMFLPGYLFCRLILGKLDAIESIVFGVGVSISLIVVSVLLLHVTFDFPLTKDTIVKAAILTVTVLIGLIELKEYISK